MRDLFFKPSVIGATCALLLLCAAICGSSLAAPVGPRGADAPPVDLNKASVEQLTEIPGIGNVTAERIVAWRDKHGPFQRVEDLMKVKGIGEKSFDKLRPHVKVSKGR